MSENVLENIIKKIQNNKEIEDFDNLYKVLESNREIKEKEYNKTIKEKENASNQCKPDIIPKGIENLSSPTGIIDIKKVQSSILSLKSNHNYV